ncbi:MtnX-like HAD-IB family phosphatase [Salisediminibacterium beveridgei]|uniref:2-hydroxy-3-keto-5-methylthiopentenyl-1-phosphate phosphatase related protein n=1 Tax=Salisediminibacterium beveridgei TaxID=632773 RepID=A0A1D7QVH1_9BACI|nr:MtnX-like HAD-IB family phosphatase [Salisediminibacterium beveridgei]AOM83011.1 2-hydroxy-3-keto-5-methylthiopentenyl-1-phosphate phosphatase related protein [Salisediminibacterium beveridgei]
MTSWAFVSDFDGTISKEDFYWLVIHQYYPEGESLYYKWKKGDFLDIEFLTKIFSSINEEEDKILEMIKEIPLDESVKPFIDEVHANGGDFIILSAGTDYYIRELLRMHSLPNVPVYSNRGFYQDGNIHLAVDPHNPFYSKRYGIDKQAVMKDLKNTYDYLFYYGDSEPDAHPAKEADRMYAKDGLVDILSSQGTPFTEVNSFKEIMNVQSQEGWPGKI